VLEVFKRGDQGCGADPRAQSEAAGKMSCTEGLVVSSDGIASVQSKTDIFLNSFSHYVGGVHSNEEWGSAATVE